MKRLPTDFDILDDIYKRYYKDATQQYINEESGLSDSHYVDIDIKEIAQALGVDPTIIFGRLYYHLDPKYRYEVGDGSHVPFFLGGNGGKIQQINFHLAASVLANLREEKNRHYTAIWIAVGSLIISVVSVVISTQN